MGPHYSLRWFQDTIQFNSPSIVSSVKSESIFLPITGTRDRGSSPEMGSGKRRRSGNSGLLFPAISCTKEERKVSSGNRSFAAKSIYKETTFQNGDSQFNTSVNIVPLLDCLHRLDRYLPTCSESTLISKVSSVHV